MMTVHPFWSPAETKEDPTIGTPIWYALQYASKGWRVLPCHYIIENKCSCGHACKSPGKHPLIQNGSAGATTDPEQITQWFTKWPKANIGLATGKESGFFAIDVDIRHDLGKYGDDSLAELTKTYGKLPDTASAITGSGGNHYLYQYPENAEIPNSTSKLGQAIDVRGMGGYVLAEPSNHLLGAYGWEGSSDPVHGDATISRAPQWLLNLLCRDQAELKINNDGMFFESSELDAMTDSQVAELNRALSYCPNYTRDEWLFIGMSLHSIAPTIAGLELWEAWSKQGKGGPKFDAKDQARVWTSFNNKKDRKLNKESIFFTARQHGFVSDAEQLKQQKAAEDSSIIVTAINRPIQHETYQPTEQPIDNLFPVNDLNKLAGFINAGSSCFSQTATTQAVIALASLVASRRYETPQGDGCHLYVGISSGSVGSIGELRYTSRGIRQVLQQCGLRRMIRDGRISSTQLLYKTLYQSPASIYLCDDYSSMIKLCQRQTTGGIEVVLNTLTRIYDEKFIQLDSPDDAGLRAADFGDDGKPVIELPSLSMLSLMHYSQLATFAKVSELGRGAVEQFLFAICDNEDMQFKEDSVFQLPDDLIAKLLTVRGGLFKNQSEDFKLAEIFSELASIRPSTIKVRFEDDIKKYDQLIDAITDNDLDDRRYRMFKNGARRNMRRLMTVLAAFDNPVKPVATKSIMEWAAGYVAGHLKRMIQIMPIVTNDEGKQDIYQKILDVIAKAGHEGISKRDLHKYCWSFKSLSKEKRDDVVQTLLDDNDISLVASKVSSGQTVKRLVAKMFLKDDDVILKNDK